MEYCVFVIQGYMKNYFVIGFIFAAHCSLSQDTLRDVYASMYARYYVLYEDNTFEYIFSHCSGVNSGQGRYERSNRKITFYFEPSSIASNSIYSFNDPSTDTLNVKMFYANDSSTVNYFSLSLGERTISSYDLNQTKTPPTDQIDSLRLQVYGSPPITIYPASDSCNVYKVYLASSWVTEYDGPTEINLKSNAENQYVYKQVGFEYVDEYHVRKRRKKSYTYYAFGIS